MKNNIITLNVGKNPFNIKEIRQAIKIFVKKNPNYSLNIIGEASAIHTLDGTDNVSLIEVESGLSDDEYTRVALKAAKSLESTGIINIGDKERFAQLMANNNDNISSPAYGVYFPTVTYGKSSLIIDVGLNPAPSISDYQDFLKDGGCFFKDIVALKNYRVGVLSTGTGFSPALEETINVLRGLPNYVGLVAVSDIFNYQADLLIIDGTIGTTIISTLKGGLETITTRYNKEVKKSIFFKLGKFFLKDVMKTMNKTFDFSFSANGYYLFGYSQYIVNLEVDAKYKEMMNAFSYITSMSHYDFNNKICQ